MEELIKALHDQIEAINTLAGAVMALSETNAALIEEMALGDDGEGENEPKKYLDGMTCL